MIRERVAVAHSLSRGSSVKRKIEMSDDPMLVDVIVEGSSGCKRLCNFIQVEAVDQPHQEQ